jgi:hypothetical protein
VSLYADQITAGLTLARGKQVTQRREILPPIEIQPRGKLIQSWLIDNRSTKQLGTPIGSENSNDVKLNVNSLPPSSPIPSPQSSSNIPALHDCRLNALHVPLSSDASERKESWESLKLNDSIDGALQAGELVEGEKVEAEAVNDLVEETTTRLPLVGYPSNSERADGAISRCIPYVSSFIARYPFTTLTEIRRQPYRHLGEIKLNHSNSHIRASQIQRSFVALPSLYLSSGRRLTWIVPLDGSLWIEGASPATWPVPSILNCTAHGSPSNTPQIIQPIIWNDSRLSKYWDTITKLREGGKVGNIIASCFIATGITSNSSGQPALLDHMRIQVDGQFAMCVRFCMDLIGEGFLRTESGIRIALIDEIGKPILLA